MLTESEKQWVAWKYRLRRDKDLAGAWCNNCPQHGRNAAGCYGEPFCPLFPDLADALEFEGRVVAKLAGILDRTLRSRDYTLHTDCTRICPAATDCTKNNRLGLDCAPYLLKWARLAVEEEMDGQDDA